ncbi:hypothetical protein BDA99DRAFT_528660 [Phascolomyces articulosus]|uniref:Required for respiratory growth protein 9, mitochondrial n=1 Tax=Phascolomyces articulosus TaxID=60185 RepID=A0AAD5P7E4_9FUNG|nr:hypothetical protein BDA99DRAFT_528660 [Phascolomyces articulosus]
MQSIQQRSIACFRILHVQQQSRNGIYMNRIQCMSSEQNKWQPKKRLSRIAMNQLRDLNAMAPEQYDIPALSEKFHISQEAVRRIIKSKFIPTHEIAQRQEENRYKAMGKRQKSFRKPGTDSEKRNYNKNNNKKV